MAPVKGVDNEIQPTNGTEIKKRNCNASFGKGHYSRGQKDLRVAYGRGEMKEYGRCSIRCAVPDDAAALADIHIRAWAVGYRGLLSEAAIEAVNRRRMEQWPEFLRHSDLRHFVAELDGRIAGFIGICPYRDDDGGSAGEVGGLYVAPDFWGRGAGTALLTFGVNELLVKGHNPIFLWVLENNMRARCFYEDNRFHADGAVKEVIIGSPQTELRYRYLGR